MAHELASFDLAVVGRNVSAGVCALALQTERSDSPPKDSQASMAWFDGSSTDQQADPFFMLLMNPLLRQLCEPWTYHLPQSFLLWGRKQLPLNQATLKAAGDLGFQKWPLALGQKIYALGVWNDCSPLVEFNSQPQFFWTQSRPQSQSLFANSSANQNLCCVQVGRTLRELRQSARAQGIVLEDDDHWVSGLQPDLDQQRLVMNASFGVRSVRKVLLVQNQDNFSFEKSSTVQLVKGRYKPLAYWKSFGSYVSSSLVSHWPRFALQLDSSFSKDFLETALIHTGCLKRLWAMPFSTGLTWVQEDILVVEEDALSHTVEPQSILALEQKNQPILTAILNENYIYPSIFTHLSELSSQVIQFHLGCVDGFERLKKLQLLPNNQSQSSDQPKNQTV